MALPWLIGAAVVATIAKIASSDDDSSSSSSSDNRREREREIEREAERKRRAEEAERTKNALKLNYSKTMEGYISKINKTLEPFITVTYREGGISDIGRISDITYEPDDSIIGFFSEHSDQLSSFTEMYKIEKLQPTEYLKQHLSDKNNLLELNKKLNKLKSELTSELDTLNITKI